MHYTTVTVAFLAVFLANRYLWQEPTLGGLLLIFFFLFYGWRLGRGSARGVITLVSTLLIAGTVIYYIAYLPSELWTLFVLLTPVGVWLLTHEHQTRFRFPKKDLFHSHWHRLNKSGLTLVTLAILLLLGLVQTLGDVQIFDAVRSTWERTPSIVLWLFALLFASLSTLALRGRERSLTLPLIMLTFFLGVGIAALVYPLGFGFDSFLHQATEDHIAIFGTIDPKPLYYIGQYVSVLFASEAFTLPLTLVDRFLLPLLAALTLPYAWYMASAALGSDKRGAMFSTLGVFLLPLSTFIVTTPQGLANLFTLILILLSLPHLAARTNHLGSLWLIGIAAVALHPLAGIPALLYLILITLRANPFPLPYQTRTISEGLQNWRQIWRACGLPLEALAKWGSKFRRQFSTATKDTTSSILFWLVAILGSVSLPVVFVLNSLLSGLPLNFSFAALAPARLIESLHFNLIIQSGFNLFLDFAYLWGGVALLVFATITISLLLRKRDLPRNLFLPALMAVILFVNYIVMKSALDFTFLINYERSNYADRLVTLMFFFLAPYVALFLTHVWQTLHKRDAISKAFVILLLVAMFTSQLYLTYPRRDNYDTSRGFNTGAADFLAVDNIEENAPTDYIVLANQQVSAAAVLRYGFKRYYGDIFYYPIPTGGELYQYFLEMNERPSREIMKEAMQLAGVNTAYYVVNDYWWQSERLVETAKREADDWFAIDSGRVHVFRFNYVDLTPR